MLTHIIVSATYLACVIFFAANSEWNNVGPNELGDFLAGTAAPPAFYWLVVGYFMQRDELALQRDELKQSRLQIERQAKAIEETSAIQQDSLKLLERERERIELKDELGTLPGMIDVLLNVFSSFEELRSPKHGNTISFNLPKSTVESRRDIIHELSQAVSNWPTELHGEFFECLQLTAPDENRMLERYALILHTWYNRNEEKALDYGAWYFLEGCRSEGLVSLMKTLDVIFDRSDGAGSSLAI